MDKNETIADGRGGSVESSTEESGIEDFPDIEAEAFESLGMEAAILDSNGVIVETNEAWNRFGEENALEMENSAIGSNYLEISRSSDDENAEKAADGIKRVIDGKTEDFSLEYPCHSPEEKRWFLMRVTSFESSGKSYVLVVHQDITERRLAELEADQRREKLEKLIGTMSHDLRNLINIAQGRTEIISTNSTAIDQEKIGDLISSINRMEKLVDDSLNLVKEGFDSLNFENVDLGELSKDAWKNSIGYKPDSTLIVEGEIESLDILADSGRLLRLFENLFKNSVEHGSPGTDSGSRQNSVEHGSPGNQEGIKVRVGVLESDSGFYVEDNGVGIPDDRKDEIFEFGYTRSEGGTGIGLAIVSQVVEDHGWDLRVIDSETGGARFEISFES